MTNAFDDASKRGRLERLGSALSWAVALLGAVVLAGWAADVPVLKRVAPGLVAMKPNAAVGFVLAGLGLGVLSSRSVRDGWRRVVGFAAGAAVFGIGLATLAEELGLDDGALDEFLFADDTPLYPLRVPGRMAPASALAFVVAGAGIVLGSAERPGLLRASRWLGLIVAALGLLAVSGYAFDVAAFYRVAPFGAMAVHTAVGLVLLGTGLACARPLVGPAAVLGAAGLGGLTARRLLPAAILVPFTLGGLVLAGWRDALFPPPFALALLSLAAACALVAVVLWHAHRLGGLERSRLAAQADARERREWLETTLASIGDAVIATETDGRVRFLNGVAEALTGWMVGDAYGLPHERVFTIEDEPTGRPATSPVARVIREGLTVALANHTVLRRRDGSRFPIEHSAAPIRGADGRLRGAVLVFRDVSERRRAHLQLCEREARLRELADAMPHVVFATTPEGVIDYANRRLVELVGVAGPTPTQVLGLLHPDDREPTQVRWRTEVERGQPFGVEYRVWDEEAGTYRWHLGQAVPVRDAEGRITRWYASSTDISAQKESEVQLEAADRRKDAFLAMLGHELRNPLAPIANGVSLLEAQLEDPAHQHVVGIMHRQVDHLRRLLDDLIDLSRISQGKILLRRSRVDLGEAAREAVEAVRSVVTQRQQELDVVLAEEELPVWADRARVVQVLTNLLVNAAKFTPRGGRIRLRTHADDERVVVRVEDEGIGIPPEELPFVFDLFNQAPQAPPDSQVDGLGVGLTLVRRLVRLHGGVVDAASEGAGRGSVFTVSLPRLAQEDGQRVVADPEAAQEALARRGPRPVRVQIVDDNRDAAVLLQEILEAEGYVVHTSHDGASAVRDFARFQPDAVLLDIGLPDTDGYAVARRIRDMEGEDGRPLVIAVTGYGQPNDVERGRRAGFDGHLLKPVDLESLFALLRRSRGPRRRLAARGDAA